MVPTGGGPGSFGVSGEDGGPGAAPAGAAEAPLEATSAKPPAAGDASGGTGDAVVAGEGDGPGAAVGWLADGVDVPWAGREVGVGMGAGEDGGVGLGVGTGVGLGVGTGVGLAVGTGVGAGAGGGAALGGWALPEANAHPSTLPCAGCDEPPPAGL